MTMAPLLLPLPRAVSLDPSWSRSSDGSRRASFRRAERLSRCDDAFFSNRRRRQSHRAFASPPSSPSEGDEVVQETLAEMIRLQVGAEEVKEFVEQESEKLRESAEKVGREDEGSTDVGEKMTSSLTSSHPTPTPPSAPVRLDHHHHLQLKAEADALAERRLTEADQGFDAALVSSWGRERGRGFAFEFFFVLGIFLALARSFRSLPSFLQCPQLPFPPNPNDHRMTSTAWQTSSLRSSPPPARPSRPTGRPPRSSSARRRGRGRRRRSSRVCTRPPRTTIPTTPRPPLRAQRAAGATPTAGAAAAAGGAERGARALLPLLPRPLPPLLRASLPQ